MHDEIIAAACIAMFITKQEETITVLEMSHSPFCSEKLKGERMAVSSGDEKFLTKLDVS